MAENESRRVPETHGLLTLLNSAVAVLAIFLITGSATWALGSAFVMAGTGYYSAQASSRFRLLVGIYLLAAAYVAAFYLTHRGS